ncbi:ankyrin repeat domain-containing protein 24-like [Acropora muricata]|uniref:ankyrin repeat domain-containing protein 24-like n=1 Tax=Acropora muricata TaxID=159855 RepID=UPI0034E38B36
MKKIKGKLVKRNSQIELEFNHYNGSNWTKYDERLIECVKNGDSEKLQVTLKKKGTSAVKLDPSGSTALHTACLNGNEECLDVLLNEQPDLSVVNKFGCSPLHVAAQSGNTYCVQRILQHKVHVGTQDGKKMTALHHAAAKGHKACVELLINNSAPLNGKDKDGRTPLLMAIQGAHEDVIQLLLERGAKVNIADNSKKTALMYASLLGLSKNAEMLLKRGANPQLTDSNDHTAEDYARLCHYQDIIDLIHNAPAIANWDVGESSEDTEQEDNSTVPAGEAILEFSNHEESEADASSNLTRDRTTSNSLSAQESFSSKASTALSSPRVVNQDLSDDIKELEEENEMLNQELNKLRIQYHKTLEKLRTLEAQEEPKNFDSPQTIANHVNGHVGDDLLAGKEQQIEELEEEVRKLTESLSMEKELRNDAEEEISTLKAQLASFQDDTVDFHSSDDDDDIDLPGVDVKSVDKTNKQDHSGQLISLHGQITTLKLENETLREQLEKQSEGNVLLVENKADMPSIPLSVYQQLKDANEVEIFKLTEELQEVKVTNESLQRALSEEVPRPQCKGRNDNLPNYHDNEQQVHHLSEELKRLKHEFEAAENEHRKTLNVYRLHLLNACHQELDPRVQEAIQMVIALRSSEQFC